MVPLLIIPSGVIFCYITFEYITQMNAIVLHTLHTTYYTFKLIKFQGKHFIQRTNHPLKLGKILKNWNYIINFLANLINYFVSYTFKSFTCQFKKKWTLHLDFWIKDIVLFIYIYFKKITEMTKINKHKCIGMYFIH